MADTALLLARLPYHTIQGYAKGLADGLEGHLIGRWEINLHGILDGLRQIERIAASNASAVSESEPQQSPVTSVLPHPTPKGDTDR